MLLDQHVMTGRYQIVAIIVVVFGFLSCPLAPRKQTFAWMYTEGLLVTQSGHHQNALCNRMYIPELTHSDHSYINVMTTDKGKPDQSQGRKATGPHSLRDVLSPRRPRRSPGCR